MKYALLGTGKTGSKVQELLRTQKKEVTCFNQKNPPSWENLLGHDVIINFLPGAIFPEYIPMLLQTKIPVISGSTGHEWPADIDAKIKAAKTKWIYASNFSLGMSLIHGMIEVLSKTDNLCNDYTFNIHEIHHTKKLDGPSGTAKQWKEWLNLEADITFDRLGDVVGMHELSLSLPFEKITLKHEALDRSIFARGAVWAADTLLKSPDLAFGLHHLDQLIKNKIQKKG